MCVPGRARLPPSLIPTALLPSNPPVSFANRSTNWPPSSSSCTAKCPLPSWVMVNRLTPSKSSNCAETCWPVPSKPCIGMGVGTGRGVAVSVGIGVGVGAAVDRGTGGEPAVGFCSVVKSSGGGTTVSARIQVPHRLDSKPASVELIDTNDGPEGFLIAIISLELPLKPDILLQEQPSLASAR